MTTPFADQIAAVLAHLSPEEAAEVLLAALDELTELEIVALHHDFEGTWARPKQLIPRSRWRSLFFFGGRRFGKTRPLAEFVGREAMAGRAMRIGFMAQNEDKALEVQVYGDSGLIECSPPWFKATFEAGRVIWPNGAQAFPFTPEKPDNIRGPGVHLFWASEVQSWPVTKWADAWNNAQIMTSLGYSRTVIDATPKRRHALLRQLLKRCEDDPALHVLVTGTIWENVQNLGAGVVDELNKAIGGTQRGEEELEGKFFDESEGALFKQEWIDRSRRFIPTNLRRRILIVDPAISTREGTDPTGIVDLGLGEDGQIHVLGDYSKKHEWDEWGKLVVEQYVRNRCDLVVVETNRGGAACTANLRVAAQALGLKVIVLEKGAPSRHQADTIYVREIHARGTKGARATPVAALYEAGRASHTHGVDLEPLENEMTTFEPDAKGESPNRLDALVHGCWELADLEHAHVDHRAAMVGLGKASDKLKTSPKAPPQISGTTGALRGLLARRGRGGSL